MEDKVKENSQIDTRSFPQIWASLDKYTSQPELRRKLFINGCCGSYQTVWNWANAKTQPVELLVRQKIAKVVSDFLTAASGRKIRTPYQTLFPAR